MLSRFYNIVDKYYSSYESDLGRNRRKAEIKRGTSILLHNNMDRFFMFGRNADYNNALILYNEILDTLNTPSNDSSRLITFVDLKNYFNANDGNHTSPIKTPTETRIMLQAMFDAGPVRLGAKTYTIDATLNIDAYPVWGMGMNSTIIRLADNSNCDVINFVGAHIGCEICNLGIDCNKNNQSSGNGIVTTNPLTKLDSIEITNTKNSAILLDTEYDANACIFNNVRILYAANGIEIKNGTTINILNNDIECCENGILCSSGSSNINIIGNHFENNDIAIKALNGDFYINGCYIYGSNIGIYATDGKVIIGDIKFSNNTKNIQLTGFGSKSLYQEIDYDDGDNANMLLGTNITTVIIPENSNEYSIPVQIQRSRGRLRSVKIIPHATITGDDTDYFSLSIYNWNSHVTEGLVEFKQGTNWNANYVQEVVTKDDDTVIAAKDVVYQLRKINYGAGMSAPGLTLIIETTQ